MVSPAVDGSAASARPELFDLFPPDAAAWISQTPLRSEYARLMKGFHRPIPWEASLATTLPADLRAELARIWAERIPTEYRSITGFAGRRSRCSTVALPLMSEFGRLAVGGASFAAVSAPDGSGGVPDRSIDGVQYVPGVGD